MSDQAVIIICQSMLYLLVLFFFLFCFAFGKTYREGCGLHLFRFNQSETLPLRGILAICVWLTHLCPHLVKESPCLTDFCLWGPPSVACFFLLSGYGLAYSFQTKGSSYLDGFFKKRLLRLLCPSLIMTFIFQCWKVRNGVFDLSSMFLEPFPMSWFIYALLIWYVIFFVCYRFFSHGKRLIVLWSFTLLYLFVTMSFGLSYYWMSILPMPIIMTIVPYEGKIYEYIQSHAYWVLGFSMSATLFVLGYATLGQYGMNLPLWGPPVYTLLPFSVLLLTLYLGGWKCRFLNFLGTISYEFYIVHGMIVTLLAEVIWINSHDSLNSALSILLCFLCVVLVAFVLNKICHIVVR